MNSPTSLSPDTTRILAGPSHLELAKSIANYTGIPLINTKLIQFANGETNVQITENIRNKRIIIVHACRTDSKYTLNDRLVELMLMVDTCKRSAARCVYVMLPYFPYSRSDKKMASREPIAAKLMVDTLTNMGIKRVMCVDLHASQIQGFTDKPFDNFYAINVLCHYFAKHFLIVEDDDETHRDYVLVSPDLGAVKRIEAYSKKLALPHAIMHKQRDYTKENVVLKSILIGEKDAVKDKTCIVVDDMADTCGTVIAAVNTLVNEHGAKDVIIAVTHGILSGPAIDRINGCENIKAVVVTNSLPLPEGALQKCPKLQVADLTPLLGEAILRIGDGRSISELFE
uniref:ribose-phosphate diphosphokinase n=1 Tax=viral metagenome TaxID=1070528 RepID=A0A6C0CMK2_9ZZZZ